MTTDGFDMKIRLSREIERIPTSNFKAYDFFCFFDLTVDKMLECFSNFKANRKK